MQEVQNNMEGQIRANRMWFEVVLQENLEDIRGIVQGLQQGELML